MAMKKLGRGLDALLGDFTATPPEGVVQADIYMIDTNASQGKHLMKKGLMSLRRA